MKRSRLFPGNCISQNEKSRYGNFPGGGNVGGGGGGGTDAAKTSSSSSLSLSTPFLSLVMSVVLIVWLEQPLKVVQIQIPEYSVTGEFFALVSFDLHLLI